MTDGTQPEAGSTAGPLSGLVIADFSRVLAGPLATMMLADLGADVIKIERPGSGDDTRAWGPPFDPAGDSSYFLSVNRNKRSVVLDLADPDDQRVAHRIAGEADVLIENFRPGVMERFGLDYDSLRTQHPGLVYCRISGFGEGGGRDLPGYDFLVQAMSGLMSITGTAKSGPLKTGVAVLDVIVGLHASIGILAALQHRATTGQGQMVDVNLMSAGLATLVNQASNYLTGGVLPGRLGNDHPNIAPYGAFRTGSEPIALAVGNDRQFQELCRVLECPETAEDDRWRTNRARVEHRQALVTIIEDRLARRPRDEWVQLLRDARVPCGPIHNIDEAIAFGREIGLQPVVSLARPDGLTVDTVANPIGLSRTPCAYRSPPPRLGEHTEEVRAALSVGVAAPSQSLSDSSDRRQPAHVEEVGHEPDQQR